MWVSRKRFKKLEKKVADLEGKIQSQHDINIDVVVDEISHRMEELLKERNKQGLY